MSSYSIPLLASFWEEAAEEGCCFPALIVGFSGVSSWTAIIRCRMLARLSDRVGLFLWSSYKISLLLSCSRLLKVLAV